MTDNNSHTANSSSFPPSDWVETTLGEVCEINPTESLPKGKIAKCVPMDCIDPFTRKISRFEGKEFNGGMKFRNGDTLLARITPCLENGKTAYVDFLDENEVGFGSTEYIVIREKQGLSYKKFLYYLTISPNFREIAIKAMTGTSGRQRVQTDVLVNKNFLLPPLPEQQAIASVLSAFDDKIELFREENKTLEEIGQVIFKEQIQPPSPLKGEQVSPFPKGGAIKKSPLGDLGALPEGWRVGKLGEVVDIFDSQRIPLSSNQRQEKQGKYPYHGATSIMDYVDEYLFDGIYLLLAEDGSVMDQNGYPVLQYVWDKFWVNNHAHVLQGANDFSTEMLYLLFKNTKIAGIVNGAVQLKINQTNLMNLEIIIPDQETLKQFDEVIQPIFAKIRNNSEQIQSLARTRDELLPRLMRGEVRVEF